MATLLVLVRVLATLVWLVCVGLRRVVLVVGRGLVRVGSCRVAECPSPVVAEAVDVARVARSERAVQTAEASPEPGTVASAGLVRDMRAQAVAEVRATVERAVGELERACVSRIARCPAGAGRLAGEWDWWRQLGKGERARVARSGFLASAGDRTASPPDEVAVLMSDAYGEDMAVDEAMRRWLSLVDLVLVGRFFLARRRFPTWGRADVAPGLSGDGLDIAELWGADPVGAVERWVVECEEAWSAETATWVDDTADLAA